MELHLCGAVHPDDPTVVCAEALTPHEFHSTLGLFAIRWPNEEYVMPPRAPLSRQGQTEMMVAIARRADPERHAVRRPVGRSSVLARDRQAQEQGMEQAGSALEPEFVEGVRSAIEALRPAARITTDDLWQWLDEQRIFTDHPKGIAALIKRHIAEGLLTPVPEDDPDAYRHGLRTNRSRLLRVYEITG